MRFRKNTASSGERRNFSPSQMRPAHPNMYGQPTTYVLPPNPVQYFTSANSPLPQYVRNPQDVHQQPQLQQPVYLVPQMHQYPGLVGMPSQVVRNPIPQAMAIQGVPAGWAYRPAMAEPAPVWGYGARGYNEPPKQEPRNWQPAPPQGYSGPGGGFGNAVGSFQGRADGHGNAVGNFQGRADGHGNGPGSFQGRADGHGNGPGSFQGRADGHGNGPGHFQGRAENVQSFGKPSISEVKRPDRGYDNSRHRPSGGAPGRSQQMTRQPLPLQSSAPLQSKQLSCEPCEKTFAVYAQYTAHMNTHVRCDDPGCSFLASGKVVKEHKLTAHSKSSNPLPMRTALRKPKESNDEIRAWREERKRNYPTRLNIQRKKEILEGKVARGELIDEDTRQRRQRMKEILAKQAALGVPVAEVPEYYLSHKDDGARHVKNSDRSNESDSRKRKLATEEHPSKSARMNTSDSNANAELHTQPECKLTEEVKTFPSNANGGDEARSQAPQKPARTQCYFNQRGRCKKGNKCHFAHTRNKKGGDKGTTTTTATTTTKGRGRHQKNAVVEKKRPPTLLSKLLHSEITRDKSYLLQCLRFFLTNNFLLDGIVQQASEYDMLETEESSDYSEGEVVEAPDVLLADTAIINTLLSERPEVLAKVLEMETEV